MPRGADGKAYVRQEVVFQEVGGGSTPAGANGSVNVDAAMGTGTGDGSAGGGVKAVQIVDDPSPMRRVYDPSHPDADAQGYVTLPNVNPVTEMVDMMTATRAYEANIAAIDSAKSMAQQALSIAKA